MDAKQRRECTTTIFDWLALGQTVSYLKDPFHYSPHLEVLFELAVKRLVAVRQAFIPLQHGVLNDFKFKYLFAVEVAVEVLANVLYDSVIAEVKGVVEVDRLDRLLLGWVEVSDCHHLTNPTQPLLMLARYLHGTSRRPRLPGTYNKLVDGSQDVAASRHTATAGIAAVACVIVAESMRDGVWDGQGWVLRYLEQVLERLAATEAKHRSFRGGTARDKCGSLSGLALYRFHHLPGGQVPIPRSDFLNKGASIGGKQGVRLGD